MFNSRGQAYDNKGDYDLAIADYTQSIRLSRDNPRAYFNRAVALSPTRATHGAPWPISTRPSGSIPEDADAYLSRGAMHEELGNEAAARADYRKALEIMPGARGCQGGAGAARQLSQQSRNLHRRLPRAEPIQRQKRPERRLRPPNSLMREREARYFLFRASMHFLVFLL